MLTKSTLFNFPVYYLNIFPIIEEVLATIPDKYPVKDRTHDMLNREMINNKLYLTYVWMKRDTYNFSEWFHITQAKEDLKLALIENRDYIPKIKSPVVYISKFDSIAKDCIYLKHIKKPLTDILSFTDNFLKAEITEFNSQHTAIPQMSSDYRDHQNNLYFLTLSDYIPVDKGQKNSEYYAIESRESRYIDGFDIPTYKKYYSYRDLPMSIISSPFYDIDPYKTPEYAGVTI